MAKPEGPKQPGREVAKSFLQRIADPGYRMPGENDSTATVEDAKRWERTYERLIKFKRDLLDLCQRYVEDSGPEAARVIRETDMVLLEVELSRFQQRHDYWKIRATELAGGRHHEAV